MIQKFFQRYFQKFIPIVTISPKMPHTNLFKNLAWFCSKNLTDFFQPLFQIFKQDIFHELLNDILQRHLQKIVQGSIETVLQRIFLKKYLGIHPKIQKFFLGSFQKISNALLINSSKNLSRILNNHFFGVFFFIKPSENSPRNFSRNSQKSSNISSEIITWTSS